MKLFAVLGIVFAAKADGHGYLNDPMTRSGYCRTAGSSPGCQAIQKSGQGESINTPQQIVYQGSDYLDYKNALPNGHICSANSKYTNIDLPADQFTPITVVPDFTGSINLKYHFTAHHTTDHIQYLITKPGTDHSKPLQWSDLVELARFDAIPKPANGYFEQKVKLPPGTTGRAVIATMWTVSSTHGTRENFVSCSDIVVSGNGGGTPPTPKPDGSSSSSSSSSQHTVSSPVTPNVPNGDQTIPYPIISINPTDLPLRPDWWTGLCATVDGPASEFHYTWTVGANEDKVVLEHADQQNARIRLLEPFSGANIQVPVKVTVSRKVSQSVRTITTTANNNPPPPPPPIPGSSSTTTTTTASSSNSVIGGGAPAWALGSYKAGDKVTGTDGRIYVCKEFPLSGWCGQTTAYQPASGFGWKDAWDVL